VELPEYSNYTFSCEVPEPVVEGRDVALPVTLANEEPAGTAPYDAVRIAVEAVGPDGAEVTFTANDHTGTPYSFTNSGYWGQEEGFALPAEYSETIDWTLNFSRCGQYTITFKCFQYGNEAEPITTHTEDVTVYLYGDADLSGTVDVFDLVFVRNRLFEEVGVENASADVNADGVIDLQDLIEARNNLGAVCEK